ncbi:jg562, partial [Pararge aegeria aegeria]
ALARRAHADDTGLALDKSSRVVATGGASVNKALLQIFADVFNTPVYVLDSHANAALLGAAIRAADVWSEHTGIPLAEGTGEGEVVFSCTRRRHVDGDVDNHRESNPKRGRRRRGGLQLHPEIGVGGDVDNSRESNPELGF